MDVLYVKLYIKQIFKVLKLSLQFLNTHLNQSNVSNTFPELYITVLQKCLEKYGKEIMFNIGNSILLQDFLPINL